MHTSVRARRRLALSLYLLLLLGAIALWVTLFPQLRISAPWGPETVPGRAELAPLTVAPQRPLPAYHRTAWDSGWPDRNGDCRDTRAELLQQHSRIETTFTDPDGCRVLTGRWQDPWTGQTYTAAADLDIDHHVPLRNAHVSGGAAWSAARQQAYYRNDRGVPGALQVIAGSTNRQKGDRGSETWQPPLRQSWCQYAQTWVEVKVEYDLTVTRAERTALADMLAKC